MNNPILIIFAGPSGAGKRSHEKTKFRYRFNNERIQKDSFHHFPKILEENKRLGIATPIGIAGRIYFIMPDGKILTEEEYKALTPTPLPKGEGRKSENET